VLRWSNTPVLALIVTYLVSSTETIVPLEDRPEKSGARGQMPGPQCASRSGLRRLASGRVERMEQRIGSKCGNWVRGGSSQVLDLAQVSA
jgi:hypothetical protein